MSQPKAAMDRLTELLAEEAATGLDSEHLVEADGLMSEGVGLDRDDFMKVAGLVQVGFLHQDRAGPERMPADLRTRLEAQAREFFTDDSMASHRSAGVIDFQSARHSRERRLEQGKKPARLFSGEMAGWYLAAALALALVVVRSGPETALPQEPRTALLAEADVVVAPWEASVAAEGYEQVAGDVVWSNDRQSGYMRLAGLAANDPGIAQYQLWIVDPDRDARPVDGGVFDVPAGQGEITIPINPKLQIKSPAAFAITLEQPGGVVVSGGPLLVVAPVTG